MQVDFHLALLLLSACSAAPGFARDYGRNPYEGYERGSDVFFPVRATDDRLHPKELVYGIVLGGRTKAYPLSVLKERSMITDVVDGEEVRVTYDAATESVRFVDHAGWVAQHLYVVGSAPK